MTNIPKNETDVAAILLRQHPDADFEDLFEAFEQWIDLRDCLDQHITLLHRLIRRGLKEAVREARSKTPLSPEEYRAKLEKQKERRKADQVKMAGVLKKLARDER